MGTHIRVTVDSNELTCIRGLGVVFRGSRRWRGLTLECSCSVISASVHTLTSPREPCDDGHVTVLTATILSLARNLRAHAAPGPSAHFRLILTFQVPLPCS